MPLTVAAGTTCPAAMLAVLARGDGAVNLYRLPNMELVKSIPAGKRPNKICADPNGQRLFVAQPAEKSIGVIDLASRPSSPPSPTPVSRPRMAAR